MKKFNTTKGPDDFETKKNYYEYCIRVAEYLYYLFTKKKN